MEGRTNRANRYRMEASKYAKLASSDPPDMVGDVHRRLADRYIRMARDLERREKDLTTALGLLNKQEYGGSPLRANDGETSESLKFSLEGEGQPSWSCNTTKLIPTVLPGLVVTGDRA
jgi:hypothetical protein